MAITLDGTAGTTTPALTNSALTSGRVTYAGTSGVLQDSANLLYSGTDLTVYGITVGRGAGAVSTNTAVGNSALGVNTTGDKQVAVGTNALLSNTSGVNNTAIGREAMYGNTTGGNNTAVGINSLHQNTTASNNSAYGNSALFYNTTGAYNTAIGDSALLSNTTASNNTAFGYQAGYGLTTGSNNTYLGYLATQSGVAVTGEIVLCTASTTGKGSNTGYINTSGGVYQGNNSASWSTTSDQRLKKNIVDNDVGLDAINSVRVRNFEYRLPEEVDIELKPTDAIDRKGVQLGIIAQELQKVLPDCVKQESTGVLSVDSDPLTWYMVNAIKQLSTKLDVANTTIQELTARLAALEAK